MLAACGHDTFKAYLGNNTQNIFDFGPNLQKGEQNTNELFRPAVKTAQPLDPILIQQAIIYES